MAKFAVKFLLRLLSGDDLLNAKIGQTSKVRHKFLFNNGTVSF